MESNRLRDRIADSVFRREQMYNMTENNANSSPQSAVNEPINTDVPYPSSQLPKRHQIMNMLGRKLKAGVGKVKEAWDQGVINVEKTEQGGTVMTSRSGKVLEETKPQEQVVDKPVEKPVEKIGETVRKVTKMPFKATDFVWREGDSMPYVNVQGETKQVKDFSAEDFPPLDEPITKLTITEEEGTHTITDPERIAVANEIARVARAIAPEHESYLLRLANFEGILGRNTRNYMAHGTIKNSEGKDVHFSSRNVEDTEAHGGLWSTDRGVFQINDAAFPAISDEIADDPTKATLFVLSAIEAGHQKKWYADKRTKKATLSYE